jgi:histidinol phosphatase-like PHP family hydrolase/predicted phosphodiesterase
MARIVVASDLHYSTQRNSIEKRRSDLSDHFLLKLLKRIDRFMNVDLLILCGDIVDDATNSDDLRVMKAIMDQSDIPYIAIPGNHDPATFYDIFPDPGTRVDAHGMRIELFHDQEVDGYNYVRSDADLDRMRHVRNDGFAGPIIALQHVSFMPPGAPTPYNIMNTDDAVMAMETGGFTLSIGGHSHTAGDLVSGGSCQYLSIGALCETPHPYHVLDITDTAVDAHIEHLAMPYDLIDQHNHTQYAYCSENMQMATSVELATTLGLGGIVFTEHSDQLYTLDRSTCNAALLKRDVHSIPVELQRMPGYLDDAKVFRNGFVRVGLEIDADFEGALFAQRAHMDCLDLKVGAVHVMQSAGTDHDSFIAEFKHITGNLCSAGIDILAHPFRIFRRSGADIDISLYPWLAKRLKETGVAVEINYHTNDPDPRFISCCLEENVPISFGSDAHNLYEVGEFYPHLQLMQTVGVSGDPSDYLFRSFDPS